MCVVFDWRGCWVPGQMDSSGDSSLSIEFECNENIQFCGYTRLIVTRGLLSQILFCFIFTLCLAPIQFVAFKQSREAALRLCLNISQEISCGSRKLCSRDGVCLLEQFWWHFAVWGRIRIGHAQGVWGAKCCADYHLNHPLPLCSDVSVSNICNGRAGQFKCPHTPLPWPALSSGPRGDCFSCRRLFVKIN